MNSENIETGILEKLPYNCRVQLKQYSENIAEAIAKGDKKTAATNRRLIKGYVECLADLNQIKPEARPVVREWYAAIVPTYIRSE